MEYFDFNDLVERSNSLSVKYNKEAIASICGNPNARPFWVADMDFKAPPAALHALQGQIEHGILGYPRITDLEETIALWTLKRHAWSVDPASIVLSPGMLASIAHLVELYSEEGEAIILPMPAYRPFVSIIKGLKRQLVPWPMLYDGAGHFTLDFDLLQSLIIQSKARLILFCSPHNPTGRVFNREELTALIEIASRFKTTIISDEIHGDLTFPQNSHTPLGLLAQEAAVQCATCIAPSKTFNIAGQHFSAVISSSPQMHNLLASRMMVMRSSPDILASVAARAAYKGGYEWLMALNQFLSDQMAWIEKTLTESATGLLFVPPEASFIGLIDCSAIYEQVVADSLKNRELYDVKKSPQGGLLSRFFGQKAAIAMNDGSWFGTEWDHFVRFNFATSRGRVAEALASIMKAARALN